MKFSELSQKKVAGIPVLYLAAAAVAILAVVAWRMKALPDVEELPDDAAAPEDGTAPALAGSGSAYDGLETNGTVTVVQPPVTPAADPNASIPDNQTWVSKAVQYLVKNNRATGGVALTAMTKFVNGDNLSFDEGELRDAAVKELGPPPDSLVTIGTTGAKPARKQVKVFPGTHTVEGPNDDSFAKIAAIEYGASSGDSIELIAAANPGRGGTAIPVKTPIKVPLNRPPRYFTATKTKRNAPDIAKIHAISVAQLWALNPGMSFPVSVGTKVRVS